MDVNCQLHPPVYNPLKAGRTPHLLPMPCFIFFAYSSNLKAEAVRFSETSIDFYQPTRRHILGDNTTHKMNNADQWLVMDLDIGEVRMKTEISGTLTEVFRGFPESLRVISGGFTSN
jgi:hypothetical protein